MRSGRTAGRVGVRLFVGNRGSGRVNVSLGRAGSKKSDPWTTLRCPLSLCVKILKQEFLGTALLSHEDNFCMQQRHDSSTTQVNLDIHHVGYAYDSKFASSMSVFALFHSYTHVSLQQLQSNFRKRLILSRDLTIFLLFNNARN